MTITKSYTDFSQSKRLAEILPLESADGHWFDGYLGVNYSQEAKDLYYTSNYEYLPAWSLAALFGVLPTIDNEFEPQLHRSLNKYRCTYEGEEDSSGLWRVANNPVDACYEMILKLHELNLL